MRMLRPLETSDGDALAVIWNAACGPALALTPRFVEYNTRTTTGTVQIGQIALQNGLPVGLELASALPDDPQTSPPDMGWIDAIAARLEAKCQGIGPALLAWAEAWVFGTHQEHTVK
jgi:hypothetical protein